MAIRDYLVRIGLSNDYLEGTKVDTDAGPNLFREGVLVSDPEFAAARARVLNSDPASDTYGQVVRPYQGSDGDGIAQPTGGSGIRGWLSGILDRLRAGVNAMQGGSLVSSSNPLWVQGTVSASGATLNIISGISVSAVQLSGGALSSTSAISGPYVADSLKLTFSTALPKNITLTDATTGMKYINLVSDIRTDVLIPLGFGMTDGRQLTLGISQTSGSCVANGSLDIQNGQLPMGGNPVLASPADGTYIGSVKVTDGTDVLAIDTRGNITPNDFILEVAKGNVSGHSVVAVEGRSDSLTTTESDIWLQGGTLVYFTSASTLKFTSTSASDTAAGTGARTVLVEGLDANYAPISEIITLNGQTAVTTVNSYLRLLDFIVLTAGSAENNVGNIYAFKSSGASTAGVPNTASDIQAKAAPSSNRSRSSHYTVPVGKTAHFLGGYASVAGSKTLTFKLRVRTFGGVFTTGFSAIFYQAFGQLQSYSKLSIPEKSDIKVTGIVDTGSGVAGISGYEILLVDSP